MWFSLPQLLTYHQLTHPISLPNQEIFSSSSPDHRVNRHPVVRGYAGDRYQKTETGLNG